MMPWDLVHVWNLKTLTSQKMILEWWTAEAEEGGGRGW